MKMRPGSVTRGTGKGDDLPLFDGLAYADKELTAVRVKSDQTARVLNGDIVAVRIVVGRYDDRAISRSRYVFTICTTGNTNIYSAVGGAGIAGYGIGTSAEIRADICTGVLQRPDERTIARVYHLTC